MVIQTEHYRGNNCELGNFERLKNEFLELFPQYELFIEKLKAAKRINSRYQLSQVLQLSKLYLTEDFIDALNMSLQYNVFNSSFIAGYLEKNHKQKFDLKSIGHKNHLNQIETLNVKRDMNEYRLFNDTLNKGLN